MTQPNICATLDSISSNAEYQKFPSDWYFLPNEAEGRAELASYLGDANNLSCINNAFINSGIITTALTNLNQCVYGSIGSSSSQIFVPSMNLASIVETEFVKKILLTISGQSWTIILISDNKKVNIFDILQLIYTNTTFPIAISNSIAHSFYGYNLSNIELVRDRPPSETPMTDPKVALSLFDLTLVEYENINAKRTAEAEAAVAAETNSIKKEKIMADLKKITLNTGEYAKIQAITTVFLKNTVVIPRFNNKQMPNFSNYTINNGWTGVLTIEGKELKDVGGGKTNPGLDDDNNITKIISGVKGEVVDKEKTFIPNAVAVLTGKIRSLVETEGKSCTSLKESDNIKIKSYYVSYFEGSTFIISYELLKKNTEIAASVATIPTTAGGKRSRRRGKKTRKKSKKTRRKGKKSKKGKKGKGRRSRR